MDFFVSKKTYTFITGSINYFPHCTYFNSISGILISIQLASICTWPVSQHLAMQNITVESLSATSVWQPAARKMPKGRILCKGQGWWLHKGRLHNDKTNTSCFHYYLSPPPLSTLFFSLLLISLYYLITPFFPSFSFLSFCPTPPLTSHSQTGLLMAGQNCQSIIMQVLFKTLYALLPFRLLLLLGHLFFPTIFLTFSLLLLPLISFKQLFLLLSSLLLFRLQSLPAPSYSLLSYSSEPPRKAPSCQNDVS